MVYVRRSDGDRQEPLARSLASPPGKARTSRDSRVNTIDSREAKIASMKGKIAETVDGVKAAEQARVVRALGRKQLRREEGQMRDTTLTDSLKLAAFLTLRKSGLQLHDVNYLRFTVCPLTEDRSRSP